MFIYELKVSDTTTLYGVDTLKDREQLEKMGVDVETLEASYSLKEKQEAFNKAIQSHLDKKAQEFRYDNIMSVRSYAGYENPFQAEAQKLALWASECWVKAGEIEAEVKAGNREMPTVKEVLAELPIFE